MSISIIILIYLLSLGSICLDYVDGYEKGKRYWFNTLCLLLIIVASSKNAQTSFDTNNYIRIFHEVPTLSNYTLFWHGYEPGYVFICMLVKSMHLPYFVVFLITSLISVLIYRHVILNTSKYIFISLFTYITCFFFLNEMIVVRHGVASAFILLELHNLSKGKKSLSIVCFIFAFLFHVSALWGIIPLIVDYKKSHIKILCITILLLSFIVNDQLFINTLEAIFQQSNNEALTTIRPRIFRHFGIENDAGKKRIILYSLDLLLVFLLLAQKTLSQKAIVYSFALCFAGYLMLSFTAVASFARFNALFLTCRIPLSSIIFSKYKNNKQEEFVIIFIIFVNVYIFVRQIFLNSGGSLNIIY